MDESDNIFVKPPSDLVLSPVKLADDLILDNFEQSNKTENKNKKNNHEKVGTSANNPQTYQNNEDKVLFYIGSDEISINSSTKSDSIGSDQRNRNSSSSRSRNSIRGSVPNLL